MDSQLISQPITYEALIKSFYYLNLSFEHKLDTTLCTNKTCGLCLYRIPYGQKHLKGTRLPDTTFLYRDDGQTETAMGASMLN